MDGLGLQVAYGPMLSVASDLTGVARGLGDVAGLVGGVEVGDAPPRTKAALESAMAAWPAAIRTLAASMHSTGDGLRGAVETYGGTDANIAASTQPAADAPYDAAGNQMRTGPHLDLPTLSDRPPSTGGSK
jgi:hypothetical protein